MTGKRSRMPGGPREGAKKAEQRLAAVSPSPSAADTTVELRMRRGRPAAPAWQRLAQLVPRGKPVPKLQLWRARLFGSIEEWAGWGEITAGSLYQQAAIVEHLLSLGAEVLDRIEADIYGAVMAAQDTDNQRFLLTFWLSSTVQLLEGRLQIQVGIKPPRANRSLAAWVWRNLVRSWLPRGRRLNTPYRREDANVWAGALCWMLAAVGQASSIGEAVPQVLRPYTLLEPLPWRGRPLHQGEEADHASLRLFARAVARVAGGRVGTWKPPPWDPEEVAGRRLRPDDVIRNHPGVKQALHRAYCCFGGEADDVTGREAALERLAVFLTEAWPLVWPPVIRRDPERREHRRVLKAETNRLRRELNLRGVPRQRAR